MILKMLLLSHLNDVSERQTEDFCNYCQPGKAFIGLGVTDWAPDPSTLSVFKARLLEDKGADACSTLFDLLITHAQAGVQFGAARVVDAVHTDANVNNEKDRKRIAAGQPSADADATVVNKGTRSVTEADGTTHDEQVTYSG
jgi:hypothetical protein